MSYFLPPTTLLWMMATLLLLFSEHTGKAVAALNDPHIQVQPDKAEHPRILARSEDREQILNNISEAPWLQESFETLKQSVDPYVNRHVDDPQWLLSRMLMHWGQHYTEFPIDENPPGNTRYRAYVDVDRRSGNAPVPTVRVSIGNVEPLMSDGAYGKLPEIEDYQTYWEEDVYPVESPKTPGLIEKVHLGHKVHWMNREISDLAANSAVLYYLTEDEKYAELAADVFMQWALGVYYQNAYNWPAERDAYTGFFNGQDLTDYNYKTMAISYDHAYDYLVRNQDKYLGELQRNGHLEGKTIQSIADKVFYKFLNQGTFRNALVHDIEAPNNHSMKQSELIWMALAIDDPDKRKECMDVFLHFNPQLRQPGGEWDDLWMGQCPWDIYFSNAIEPETGLWIEPPAYHQFPIRAAVRVAAAMDVNGYDTWEVYPSLLKATYAQFRFAFPDGTIAQFGDSSGAMFPDAVSIEFAIAGARRVGMKEEETILTTYLKSMIDKGQYTRKADYKQILYYVPELMETEPLGDSLPRTDHIPYASLYLQRVRGGDSENGLMTHINAGRFVHHQQKGLDMELYGPGRVLGPFSGTRYPYYSKHMQEYDIRAGAANTVIPGKELLRKDYDPLEMQTMDPQPLAEAVSDLCSFTDVSFRYNNTDQRRVTAIIATPEHGGFYMDLFRSNHPEVNDYIYRNAGSTVELLAEDDIPLETTTTDMFNVIEPGYQYYEDKKAIKTTEAVTAEFTANDYKGEPVKMRAYFPAGQNQTYVSAKVPVTWNPPKGTPKENYLRAVAVRRQESAWDNPFVVVFEPFRPDSDMIKRVTQENFNDGDGQLITVMSDDQQWSIFNSLDGTTEIVSGGMKFIGTFGVVARNISTGKIDYLYLGSGKLLSAGNLSVRAENSQVAANVVLVDGMPQVRTTGSVIVTYDDKTITAVANVKPAPENNIKRPESPLQVVFHQNFPNPSGAAAQATDYGVIVLEGDDNSANILSKGPYISPLEGKENLSNINAAAPQEWLETVTTDGRLQYWEKARTLDKRLFIQAEVDNVTTDTLHNIYISMHLWCDEPAPAFIALEISGKWYLIDKQLVAQAQTVQAEVNGSSELLEMPTGSLPALEKVDALPRVRFDTLKGAISAMGVYLPDGNDGTVRSDSWKITGLKKSINQKEAAKLSIAQ